MWGVHQYVVGEPVKYEPFNEVATDCSEVSIGIEGYGVKMSESRSVCDDKLKAEFVPVDTNKLAYRMQATWVSRAGGATGAQNSLQANVTWVEPNDKASGFQYTWHAETKYFLPRIMV